MEVFERKDGLFYIRNGRRQYLTQAPANPPTDMTSVLFWGRDYENALFFTTKEAAERELNRITL